MVCSLHSVTTGSRDRANVSLIIIIIIMLIAGRYCTLVYSTVLYSLLHIESNLDRLGLLSPTHGERCQHQSGRITLFNNFDQQAQVFKDTSCRNKGKW